MTTTASDLLVFALKLHGWGMNVTAINPGTKAPCHAWNRDEGPHWLEEAQTEDEVKKLPWRIAAGIGYLAGVNGFFTLDFDDCPEFAPPQAVLDKLHLPHSYRWLVRTRSGWHIVLCLPGGLPDGLREHLAEKQGEKGTYWATGKGFDHLELRLKQHNVLPPTPHPDGGEYIFYNGKPTTAPLEIEPERLTEAVQAVTFAVGTARGTSSPSGNTASKAEIGEIIPKGKQHLTLVSAAGSMRHRGFTPDEIFPSLWEMNKNRCEEPGPEENIRKIAESVGAYAVEPGESLNAFTERVLRRMAVSANATLDIGGDGMPADLASEQEAPLNSGLNYNDCILLHRNLSDVGNAQRFHDEHRGWVLFAAGAWYEYVAPGIWKSEADQDSKNPDAPAVRRCMATIRRYLKEAEEEARSNPAKEAVANHARSSESYAKIMATVNLAQRMNGFSFDAGRFDQLAWAINTPAGVVDLRTGDIRPQRREDYWTKITTATYDPDDPPWHVIAPQFEQHLSEILPDPALRQFLQDAAGLSLTGKIGERLFVVLGPGGTGKTTTFKAIHEAIGTYFTAANASMFMRGKAMGTGPQPEVVRLRGARMAVAKETRDDIRWDEASVKQLTDRDPLLARDLYRSLIQFNPTHALWVTTNHAPVIVETDSGIWRRVMVVPFETKPKKRDEFIDGKLKQEKDGVLRWMIEGAMRVAANGLDIPNAVKGATMELQEERDTLSRFIEERLERTELAEQRIQSTTLYKSFRQYCIHLGEPCISLALFGREMKEKLPHIKSGGIYYTHVQWRET